MSPRHCEARLRRGNPGAATQPPADQHRTLAAATLDDNNRRPHRHARRHRTTTQTARLAALLLLAATIATAHAAPRRILHVSLYPYIPQPEAAALTLKQGFEALHPDVIVQITFNPNYYDTQKGHGGLLEEQADIHEIDGIFLQDFIARRGLAPLPPDLADPQPYVPLAAQSATIAGRMVAVPHWLCADFLFYRADRPAIGQAKTLAQLQTALAGDHLLLDMAPGSALAEFYTDVRIAEGATNLATAPPPDAALAARARAFLALEPPGFGRSPDYDLRGTFYARQFARRAGAAFIGYSEMTHDILDETATSCTMQDRCLTVADIRIAPVPFADARVRPAVWDDMLAIDVNTYGQTSTDAADFIRYVTSLPAYRALLIYTLPDPPRYLLPATNAAYTDRLILHAAPLYPSFRAILNKGAVTVAPRLTSKLSIAAAQLSNLLLKTF